MLLVLCSLVGLAIELRVRKLLRKGIDSAKVELEEKWRRELQQPIGDIGIDAMKALDATNVQGSKIVELETKMGILWRMIENSTANLLKRPEE